MPTLAVDPHQPVSPETVPRRRTPVRGGAHVIEAPLRMTLLAKNAAGWGRLCRIVSAAHLADSVPTASWDILSGWWPSERLVGLLGGTDLPRGRC